MKTRHFFIAALAVSVITYSCKKENVDSVAKINDHSQIIKINNNVSSNRVDLNSTGLTLPFYAADVDFNNPKSNNHTTASNYPFELVYTGKINPQIGADSKPLSALEVSAWGTNFAVGYQTPGPEFGGGVDVISLTTSGVPSLVSSASIPDADVTCVAKGNSRLYLGMDLKNFEHYDFPAPATMGYVHIQGGALDNPQVIGLEGYSTKDIKFNQNNLMIYAATSTQGGVVSIKLNHNGSASRVAYQPYGTARSIGISGSDLIVTNGFSYSFFNPSTLAMSNYSWWPIPSTPEPIGRMATLSNGNFVFGNSMGFVYVDKTTGSLIDQVDIGGIVNGVTVDKNKIYITTGNSLIIAQINSSNKIELLAKTHFSSTFGGDFNVIGSKVFGSYVLVACGNRGTYVFKLKQTGI